MKNTIIIILSGLLLCGCSKKHAASASPVADLVQAGTDATWRDGSVLRITKRDGASLQGVTFIEKLPTGQTQTFSADTATLSADPSDTDNNSFIITLHGVKKDGATLGDCAFKLSK